MNTLAEVKEYLTEQGYEDAVVFGQTEGSDTYAAAFIGVTHDGRAVYDYDLMVKWLIESDGISEEDAREWIDYNTIRALPYAGPMGPLVLYPI